jgi:hypothetical protein
VLVTRQDCFLPDGVTRQKEEEMRKLRAAVMAACFAACLATCLALTLVFAAAPLAHAATPPPPSTCNIWVNSSYGAVYYDPTGRWTAQVWIQELKSSDGTTCAVYRGYMAGHSIDGHSHSVSFDHWLRMDGGTFITNADWNGTLPASGAAVFSATNTASVGCGHIIWAQGQIGVSGDEAYATGPNRNTSC